MAGCIYRYTPSEQYQRTPPGCAPETHCGSVTYPMYDEPELIMRVVAQQDGTLAHQAVPTGVLLPRTDPDPYCPAHGGTAKPDANVIHMHLMREYDRRVAELEALRQQLDPLGGIAAAAIPAGVVSRETSPPAGVLTAAAPPDVSHETSPDDVTTEAPDGQ